MTAVRKIERTHSSTSSLLAAVLAVVLVTVLFGLYAMSERETVRRDGYAAARQGAEFTALAIEGTLDSARYLLRAMTVLADRAEGERRRVPEIESALRRWQSESSYIMDLLILDAEGRIRHWTGPGQPPDVRERPYYTAHARSAGSGLHVGKPLLSLVHEGRWFFALSEAQRDGGGKLRHVVVAILDVQLLHDRLHLDQTIPGSSQALLGDDGVVYVRTPDHDRHVGKQVSRKEIFASLTDKSPSLAVEDTSQIDGRTRILAFRKVGRYPMIAAATIEKSALFSGWRRHAAVAGSLWALIVLGIVGIAWRLNLERRALSDLASIDSLTGILNRRTILDTATMLDRSLAHAGELALLMIDADHFKDINDRFGHLVGDEVLRHLSDILRRNVRAQDIVGRYGGEEFLVLMPDTGEPGALTVAEKLRSAVERQLRQPIPLTISVGVATTQGGNFSLDRTLAHADAALYAAKSAGRNCVRSAEVPAAG